MNAAEPSASHEKDISISEIVKLDHTGLPLIPQPTTSPFDPLNYPNWLKHSILAQVCCLAFLATLNVAIINPAVVPLADEFRIAHVTATYQTTVAIGTSALGPLFFTPFANVYGRRPAYLLSVLIGFASAVGSAKAKSFGTLVVARAFNGFGPSAALGLGAGTVIDLFFMHQRGKAMGIFTLMLTNGAHLAPIVGGYVARDRGWRWCFWVGAILNGVMFIIAFFFMPETLFDRPVSDDMDEKAVSHAEKIGENGEAPITEIYGPPMISFKDYSHRLWFWDLERPPSRKLKATDFVIKPLSMLKYPSVAFPALYYAVTYGFASIEPALTLATLFTEIYNFNTVRNGQVSTHNSSLAFAQERIRLANGVSLLVGASLGELLSGPVTDAMMARARRQALKHGELAPAEVRLQGIWTGAVTVPAGLLIWLDNSFRDNLYRSVYWYGYVLQFVFTRSAIESTCMELLHALEYKLSHLFVTLIAAVIAIAPEVMTLANASSTSICASSFFRQIFGLTLGFYSIPFGEKIGFEWSFTVFTAICLVTFLPIVALMYTGEKWRMDLGQPETS